MCRAYPSEAEADHGPRRGGGGCDGAVFSGYPRRDAGRRKFDSATGRRLAKAVAWPDGCPVADGPLPPRDRLDAVGLVRSAPALGSHRIRGDRDRGAGLPGGWHIPRRCAEARGAIRVARRGIGRPGARRATAVAARLLTPSATG